MAKSSIEWTEMTWNPVTGCTKISSGCKHCYAEVMSNRLQSMGIDKYMLLSFLSNAGGETKKAAGRLLDGQTYDEMPELELQKSV